MSIVSLPTIICARQEEVLGPMTLSVNRRFIPCYIKELSSLLKRQEFVAIGSHSESRFPNNNGSLIIDAESAQVGDGLDIRSS